MNKICTAIVTYNRLELLKGALESIRNQTQPSDILIVNNGSTDGTGEYLDTLEGITIINQDNVGGAGGFFTALKYIAEHGYEYAWVMDDDIIADPDTLSALYNAYQDLSDTQEIGFLCSTVLSPDKETVNVPTICMDSNATGYPEWNKYLDRGIVRVQAATFVSVFLSTEIICQVGLPIKEYFIWGDDTEYTKRISSKYKCYLIGSSKIRHLRNGGILSLKTINDPKRIRMFKYYVRNNIHNEMIYGTSKSIVKLCYYFLKESASFFFSGNFQKSWILLCGVFSGLNYHSRIEFPILPNSR